MSSAVLTSSASDLEALLARLAALESRTQARDERIELLEEENRWLKAQLFGRSSEKTPAEERNPEQAVECKKHPVAQRAGAMSKCTDLNQRLFRWGTTSRILIALVLSGASACADTLSNRDIAPPCESPAPLEGGFDSRAPGFIIELQPADDVVSVAHDLAIRYRFDVRTVGSPGPVFIAGPMTPQTVAALRCDPALKAISHDGYLVHVTLHSSSGGTALDRKSAVN